jgi:hypothetical protein
MKIFHIEEKVFKTEPLIIYNCSYEKLYQFLMKKYKVELKKDDNPGSATMLDFDKSPWRVLWFKELKNKSEDLGEIVHEIFHLVVKICEDKQVPIISYIQTGECGDETGAYLIDFFFREIYKKIYNKK